MLTGFGSGTGPVYRTRTVMRPAVSGFTGVAATGFGGSLLGSVQPPRAAAASIAAARVRILVDTSSSLRRKLYHDATPLPMGTERNQSDIVVPAAPSFLLRCRSCCVVVPAAQSFLLRSQSRERSER
jgi:hypothetical protein